MKRNWRGVHAKDKRKFRMNHVKENYDSVKYDEQACIDLYKTGSVDLGAILSTVISGYGNEILCDSALLGEAMREAGAPAGEIFRVQLMTQVSGFQQLLLQDPRTAQVDLDRYIQNATEQTGFNRDMILRLTGSIVSTLGGTMECASPSAQVSCTPQTIAVLATSLHEETLRGFQRDLEQVVSQDSGKHLDFDCLEPLVNVGIPRAKYLLGYCLLYGIQLEANEERGLELLEEAADLGDSKAAAALGDHYYASGSRVQWTRAYQYYTGYGAAALNPGQQAAMTNILNQKVFNRTFLTLSAVLWAVFAAVVALAPAAAVFAPRRVVGWLCLLGQAALWGLAVQHHRCEPYDSLYWLPVGMTVIWLIYMAVRIVV